MIYKTLLSLLLTSTLFAQTEYIIAEDNKMVKLTKPKEVESIYVGSFLAQGHLPASHTYSIDAPLEGVVNKLATAIYEPVKKGDLLAVIKSPKILELEATYINILIEEEYYTHEVERLEPLYRAAVVAKKQFLKTKNTLDKYQTQAKFYAHLLEEWGLSKKQVQSIKKSKKPLPTINIYAPISGKVADLNIYPKMYLQRGEHMMTIVDTSAVHLEISLPITIAKNLHTGMKLFLNNTDAQVEAIAAKINARTQTLSVHILTDASLKILPNEKKNVKLYWPKKAFSVPNSSLIELKNRPALFVKLQQGYKLVFVTILSRDNKHTYVESKGFNAQSQIVSSGAISLKGALSEAKE